MKSSRQKISEKIPGSYNWFVGIAITVILLIIIITYSFFEALSQNQLDARKQFLNKQVQFAAGEIQQDFKNMYENMVFFSQNLEPWTYQKNTNERLAFEKRARRIFNNHRNIIDSIVVIFPNTTVSFHFDEKNNFVKTMNEQLDEIQVRSKEKLHFKNPRNQVEIIAKINLNRYLGNKLGSFYIGTAGEKLLFVDGNIYRIDEYFPKTGNFFESETLNNLKRDIQNGLKGEYEGYFSDSYSDAEFQAVILQYPFLLNPLESQFAVIFVQDRQLITSGIYLAYFSLFVGMFLLLIFVILILYQFNKNTQTANRILAEQSTEINELFRQQTLLLQESKGFIYFQEGDGAMTNVSKEVKDVLGYNPEYFSANFKKLISPKYLPDLEKFTKKSIEEKRDTLTFEFDFLKADKEWVRCKIFEKLLFNEKGEFLGHVGLCTDIHEKYQSEQELKISENRLRAVLKSLPDLIFIYDHAGNYLDYYVQNENLLVKPASDSIGKNIIEVLPEPNNQDFMRIFKMAVETGTTQSIQWEMNLNIGKRIFETSIFMLDDQRMISIGRDITGQKLWEKGLKEAMLAAEQSNKAKSEFLANMSHEIRTPMNGLLGIIDLLFNTKLSPRQREYLEVIKDSGNSLSAIINDILDYSKIEAGMMTLNLSTFHFKDEIEKNFRIFSALIQKKNIKFNYQFGPLIPEFIEADKEKLGQVLFNLIGNAIKFTPEYGEITVHITDESVLKDNIMLNFSISDTGIGIPEDKIKKLGQAFVQVDSSNTRQFNGTGLGLAICKKLIELMGGELTIESVENVGSTFSFTIFGKVWSPENEICLVPNLSSTTQDIDWKGMAENFPLNILLVEDNDINRQFMEMLMKELGYDFKVAKDGYEALEKVKEKQFDLIFMDIQMPRLNGLESTKLIRKLPEYKDVKIIGLSANAFQENVLEAKAAGMDEYLTKPVKIDDIAIQIRECYLEKNNKRVL